MAYTSRRGRRPDESASKSAHSHIINDPEVKAFIDNCEYPKDLEAVKLDPSLIVRLEYPPLNQIEHIVAMDGGYTKVAVRKTFPSSSITFFQFGELLLNVKDLEELSNMAFIPPEAMSKLNELERSKLVLPTKNVSYGKNLTLTHSVRVSIFEFFKKKSNNNEFLKTLFWLVYGLYDQPQSSYELASCPFCERKEIKLERINFDNDYCIPCPHCAMTLLLTDIFRLHEAVDDELGAEGILGYLTNLIEQMNIIHTIRVIKEMKPILLNHFLFIKDGPLAFFGQTANMHGPVRKLFNYLFKHHNLFLAGLEKSGAFVEHADEIKGLLTPGQALLLNNRHIYTYILPNDPNSPDPYGGTSYYGAKLIFKSTDERMYVITVPVEDSRVVVNPQKSDFKNLDMILWNIEKLRCDMYDNAIVPVALANKLISLSNHPSALILEKFAKKFVRQ
jgi:hypothetical protein